MSSIKQYLSVLKLYYFSINKKDNPVLKLQFPKREYTIPINLLTNDEMVALYTSHPVNKLKDKRDVVMLGLCVFQSLKISELEQLELNHIDLDKGTIYVPSTTTTNARTIKLEVTQMKYVYDYIYTIRDLLLREKGTQTNRLFFSLGLGSKMRNAMKRTMNEIRGRNKAFRNLTQLRESRLSLWLSEYGVSKTQYLSGMKYASSLKRYERIDTEKLGLKINKIHPMERM